MFDGKWKLINTNELKDHYWYLIAIPKYGTPMKARYHSDSESFTFFAYGENEICRIEIMADDIDWYCELPNLPWEDDEEKHDSK